MRVRERDEVLGEFVARAHRMVWAVMATVDPAGRPRTRLVHPVWEDGQAWVTVRPDTPKARDLAGNLFVSLAYVSEPIAPVYAECEAVWVTDAAERRRAWAFIAGLGPPAGFDPAAIFPGGPDGPGFGLLRLAPWRLRLANAADRGAERIWQASASPRLGSGDPS